MRIVMVTNTYAPHVGGVARSVEAFANEYRRRGHQVLVVCPSSRTRRSMNPMSFAFRRSSASTAATSRSC